jgi:hypothetical protein
MATTTNYGWTTPDDTALVKDGAAAIRTLGTSVDTTTKNLNPSTTLGDIEYRSSTANTNTRLGIGTTGQILTVAGGVPSWATAATPASGLTLIKRASYSAVANTSTTFDGVFTSAYKNYVVVIDNANASTANELKLNYRVSGSTQSVGSYNYSMYRLSNAVSGGWVEHFRGSSQTASSIGRMASSTSRFATGTYEFYGVGNSSTSPWVVGSYTSAQDAQAGFCWSYYEELIVADGFILTASTGTISGTVSVYGRAI